MSDDFLAFSKVDEEKEIEDTGELNAPALLTSTPAPWLSYSYQFDRKAPPLVRLHNEILNCCEYIAPSVHEMNQRDVVLSEVSEVIHSLWPTAVVSVFGSQMTKILTPTSDLDLVIMGVPENKRDPSDMYFKLTEKLRVGSLVSYCEAITNAKVPIVKLDHRKTGISVDICINNDSGIRTGKLIRKYVREYPPLRPMVLILKLFLTQRRMNETFHGGVGSFVLTLMIVSFLQMKQRQCAGNHNTTGAILPDAAVTGSSSRANSASLPVPSWNLGTLLLEFFHLYGVSFNYFSVGISVTEGGSYLGKRKKCKQDSLGGRPNMLYLENPDLPELDVGRNSYTMPKIRRAFEHAHQLLTVALGDPRVPSYLAYVVRPDDPVLQDRPGPELGARRSNADALR